MTDQQAILRAVMQAKGWGLRETAENMGCSREALTRWLADPQSRRYIKMPMKAQRRISVLAFYSGVGFED